MGAGKKDESAENALKFQKEQMARLEGLSLPELEEYLLENPELVGELEAQTIQDSGLKDIQLDGALRQNQMDALEGLRQRSEEGITAEDKYAMETMLGDVAAQERSQRASIEDQMARQGMDSSGFAERTKREAVQSGANNARAKAMQMAAQGQQNRMSALQALGAQSGQMEQADYGRKANAASAQDAISRANAMNRQNVDGQNLAARQAIENSRAGIANQQAQVGNQIAQQRFNNEVTQVTGQGNVANSMSNIAGNAQQGPNAMQAGLAGAATGAAIGGPWGAAAGGAAGALSTMFEDGGIAQKENLPIQYQQRAQQQEYQDAEKKQHESFKKKYMKRVQDEIMGSADKPKTPKMPQGKENGGVVYAQNGVIAEKKEDNMFSQDKLNNAVLIGQGNDGISGEVNTLSEADELAVDSLGKMAERAKYERSKGVETKKANEEEKKEGLTDDKLSKGLGALSKMMAQPEKKQLKLGAFSMGQPQNVMQPAQIQEFSNPFGQMDQVQFEDGGISDAKLSKGLGALSKMMAQPKKKALELGEFDMGQPQNTMEPIQMDDFSNPFGQQQAQFEDGGTPMYASDGTGDIVDSGNDSYANDRVDAKINDGEMILNVPQQQRLMDLIRGEISVDELGTDDIVEGVPRDFRDEMHEEADEDEMGNEETIQALLKLMGK